MSRYIVRTYKVPVPRELYPLCSELNRLAGRIYNKTMSLVKKVKSKKGFWLSPGATQKYILRWSSTINIHTHSKQAIVQQYFQALNSYFTAVKTNPQLKPPHKKKRFMPFIWKDTAIKLSPEGVLRLSMGSSQEPILIQTTLPAGTTIRQVRLVYEAEKYYLHLAIEVKNEHEEKQSVEVMSVDLGILRPITCFDGSEVISYHGGILNSLIRYRNKKLADFQQTLSKCKKGSKRYRKLLKAKQRMLKRTKHQITDILHKITSNFLGICAQRKIATIMIGDVTNIRERVEGNDNFNQKVHQWCFRKMVDMITYKAQLLGIQVCPVCGSKNHAVGRNYECKSCGFRYHRDGVGAINIWQRYLGKKFQVVAGLAPVRGVRFKPHLCGHGVSNAPWKAA
ncbi:RNA-guided endonuclease InsQ/TnpB family protein [Pseudothermotoga hypogea]|uniref:RNA-guided endonuclease InsQ/TnpB family protein n=1 Tax=Pseudothermotoga hypogea TaxID=57487 RepID=UPI00059D9596|nr:RNA-guided endonuclease TnpB family protein [Pseudothermotoga hypogea]